MMLRGVPGCGV
uniref:Uncharacterized protein n=1 Tax=Arundo donax TaxID=35708 RepID=A0A0A8XVY4_ARUDO